MNMKWTFCSQFNRNMMVNKYQGIFKKICSEGADRDLQDLRGGWGEWYIASSMSET